MVENLFCELDVAFGAAGAGVVGEDRFAEAGGLGEADAARNDGLEDLVAEELSQIGGHLAGQVGAVVEHGEENAFDFEGVVEGVADAVDRVHEFGDAFEGEELALNRNEDGIGGEQRIECEKVEGRRAVDQDEVVVVRGSRRCASRRRNSRFGHVDQFQIGADQVLVGGDEVEAVEIRRDDGVVGGSSQPSRTW